MSLKQKALLQTVGLLVLAVVCSGLVNFILATASAETIYMGLGVGFVAFFVWMFYSITLGRLQYEEKLKEMKATIKG